MKTRLISVFVVFLLALTSLVMAVPARAVGSYSNASIADTALTYLGQNLGTVNGQCKQFANNMVNAASGGAQVPSGYQTGWGALGDEVSSADALRGDIIQVTPAGSTDSTVESLYDAGHTALHTAIILANNGGGNFWVVDANWGTAYTVSQHSFSPYSWAANKPGSGIVKIWRMGTVVSQAPVTPLAASVPVRADVDGDGYDDLLAIGKRSDAAPNLVVFRSTGTWMGGSELWAAPGNLTYDGFHAVPADLDGDHKADLMAIQKQGDGNSAPLIYWHQSTGTSFASPQLVGVPNLVYNDTRWASGDFSGDGHDDLLAISKRGDPAANLIVMKSTGSWLGGTELWGAPAEFEYNTAQFIPADVDGDGKDDLIGIHKQYNSGTAPVLWWMRSTGSSFEVPVAAGIPNLVADNTKWQVGDFNGDGKDDLLAMSRRAAPNVDPAPNLIVLPSTGSGLGATELWSAPGDLVFDNFTAVIGDLDGDGKDDLLAAQKRVADSNVSEIWWVKAQPGNFASPQLVGVPGMSYGTTRWQY